jgi:hypothetical protein
MYVAISTWFQEQAGTRPRRKTRSRRRWRPIRPILRRCARWSIFTSCAAILRGRRRTLRVRRRPRAMSSCASGYGLDAAEIYRSRLGDRDAAANSTAACSKPMPTNQPAAEALAEIGLGSQGLDHRPAALRDAGHGDRGGWGAGRALVPEGGLGGPDAWRQRARSGQLPQRPRRRSHVLAGLAALGFAGLVGKMVAGRGHRRSRGHGARRCRSHPRRAGRASGGAWTRPAGAGRCRGGRRRVHPGPGNRPRQQGMSRGLGPMPMGGCRARGRKRRAPSSSSSGLLLQGAASPDEKFETLAGIAQSERDQLGRLARGAQDLLRDAGPASPTIR